MTNTSLLNTAPALRSSTPLRQLRQFIFSIIYYYFFFYLGDTSRRAIVRFLSSQPGRSSQFPESRVLKEEFIILKQIYHYVD